MDEKLSKFDSPAPQLVGDMNLETEEMTGLLETIRSAAPLDGRDLSQYDYKKGAKIIATWNYGEYPETIGTDSQEVIAAIEKFRDEFKASIGNGNSDFRSMLFSARWTLPDPDADIFTDTPHADSDFYFCPIAGLPIEYYEGPAEGIVKRFRADGIQFPKGASMTPVKFGEIWHFDPMTVHRRGMMKKYLESPVLRMHMRAR